jgi:hypothetical protein
MTYSQFNLTKLWEKSLQQWISIGNAGNVSMLVKWSPNSVTATRRFHGPSHPRLFGGAKALELSVPRPKPAAYRNYFRVLMLVIPFYTYVYTLRF